MNYNKFLIITIIANIFFNNLLLTESNKNIKKIEEKKMAIPTAKIGFVNVQQIINIDKNNINKGSHEWMDLYNELQNTIEPVKKELKNLEEKYNKSRLDFENLHKSGISSKEALQKKYEELSKIEYELRTRTQELEQFAQNEIAKAQMIVGPKIDKAIAEVKNESNLDIILRGEIILAANIEFDLTQKVIDKINKEYQKELEEKKAKEKKNNNKEEQKK